MEKEKNQKEERRPRMKVCPICNREFEGYGNNPEPLMYRKPVCDECNYKVVIPTRLIILQHTSKLSK